MAIAANIQLVSQFVGGFAMMGVTGTVGYVSLKTLKPEIFNIFPDVMVFAKAEAPVSSPPSTDIDPNNIKCQLVDPGTTVDANKKDVEKVDCKVFTTTTTDFSKGHVSANAFSEPLTKLQTLTVDKYYKLNISKKVWNQWDSKQTQKIEVYSGDSKLDNNLTPLFMMFENYMYAPTPSSAEPKKSNNLFHFVASAKAAEYEYGDSKTKVTVSEVAKSKTANLDYVCDPENLWNHITLSKDCKVYDFSTSSPTKNITEYSSLNNITFNKSSTVVSKVENTGFYVIEAPWTPKKIANDTEKDKFIALENVCPAIVADSKLFIFWLEQPASTKKTYISL